VEALSFTRTKLGEVCTTTEEFYRDGFRMLDLDGDNMLSLDEMREFYKEMGLVLDDDHPELISELDGADKISFKEFLRFIFAADNDGIVLLAFKMYDLDKDGKISRSELHAAIVSELHNNPKMKLNALMKEADINRDDVLDFEEFKAIFTSI